MWHNFYYISLYVGAERLVFHLNLWDAHVIIVSGCLILAAVNLIILIRMAYITERPVKLCKVYCNIWHRLTWSVCTGGWARVSYVITKLSRMDSLPNFVTLGAPLLALHARESSAITPLADISFKGTKSCCKGLPLFENKGKSLVMLNFELICMWSKGKRVWFPCYIYN